VASPGAFGAPVSAITGAVQSRTVVFEGYRVVVPGQWRVVDLTSHPHACVRFDHPAVYLGHAGDQSACPARLIGGAPGLVVQPLDARSALAAGPALVSAAPKGAVRVSRLPATGPVTISVPSAGVAVTAVYGASSSAVVGGVLSRARVTSAATPAAKSSLGARRTPARTGSAPGSFAGLGFDACTAPSQSTMDAWRASSDYRAVGVYIGGVSRGCDQPRLTAGWVAAQVKRGWHLIPTYVGLQAPCTRFYNRMSYDTGTAWQQGRAAAADAVVQASALGMAAPSTVYADVEGYDNTGSKCVAATMSYLAGWTRGLHGHGYDSGVYSSASSGIRDLATNHASMRSNSPDDIWIAWWNAAANADGGTYVGDSLWSSHQRVHQYAGNVSESYGGYRLPIDRDYLDVSADVPRPSGCPTRISFNSYPAVRRGDQSARVVALQCQLARRGFNPGAARGVVRWRTEAAIRAFKASRGLQDTAVVRRRAWTALLSAGTRPLLSTGSTSGAVNRLQRSLSASLRQTVHVTGTFGGATRHAVRGYQRARGLTVDGTANRQTWKALQAGR
jgi:glycoside hydrolase-like protein/putative peptidoglycan binding protein